MWLSELIQGKYKRPSILAVLALKCQLQLPVAASKHLGETTIFFSEKLREEFFKQQWTVLQVQRFQELGLFGLLVLVRAILFFFRRSCCLLSLNVKGKVWFVSTEHNYFFIVQIGVWGSALELWRMLLNFLFSCFQKKKSVVLTTLAFSGVLTSVPKPTRTLKTWTLY